MSDVAVRPAKEQDLAAILALERATPEAPHWAPRIYAEMVLAGAPEPGSAEGRARCLVVAVQSCSPGRDCAEEIAGFVSASALSGSPAELESIVVRQSARRKGIGRLLCTAVMDWARRHGTTCVELEVRATNAVALSLYQSLGFGEIGRRPRYYRDPEDDAVLLRAKLKSNGEVARRSAKVAADPASKPGAGATF